jgi:hypothetical protein
MWSLAKPTTASQGGGIARGWGSPRALAGDESPRAAFFRVVELGGQARRCHPLRQSAVASAAQSGPATGGRQRFALIVTGASGGPEYARKYQQWRTAFADILRQKFGYPKDHVLLLADEEADGVRRATRDNVRGAFADLRRRAGRDDVVTVLLMGHGTGDAGDASKFNLVGPDLTAAEWAGLARTLPGTLVFVNAASGSFPFLALIAGPGRVVITASDSPAQQFETVFPEFLVLAFSDQASDRDRNGRVSVWEAFTYAAAGVRQWFDQRGQLATERPLLDDSGDGIGREADAEGPDGAIAQVTYLQSEAPVAATSDAALTALLGRRAEVQRELDELRARKPQMPAEAYDAQLEKLLIELARLDRRIREKS